MDLRRLEVFCKLMETGSFSKTGEDLDLTQPTISGHVKTLEQQIGLQLFDRRRRRVTPTAAAKVLYDYALRILELHREAGFALERFRGRIAGPIVMGGSTIPGAYLLPPLIGRFHRLHPETRIQGITGGSSRIVELTLAGDVEFAVVGVAPEHDDLACEPLTADEMVLAAPPDEGLGAGAGALPLSALKSTPLIMRAPGSGTRSSFIRALSAAGVNPEELHVVAELGSTEAVRQAVKAGLGASVISRAALADDLRFGLLAAYRIQGLDLSRMFYLIHRRRRTLSPAALAFMDYLRAEASNALTREERL
jgi:DNA-binding transcriptional LysR family regulator